MKSLSERVILHSDMNCFYASVEMLHHPEFAGMPLAVGGDPEARSEEHTSELQSP